MDYEYKMGLHLVSEALYTVSYPFVEMGPNSEV